MNTPLSLSNKSTRLPRNIFSIFKRRILVFIRDRLHLTFLGPDCNLCGSVTKNRIGYNRPFHHCLSCGLIHTLDYDPHTIIRGMGMKGSWSGPGGGGYREYYLVKMLLNDLNKKSFLLFGTGNTSTFDKLKSEGVHVIGSDISRDVIAYKRNKHGNDSFFHPDEIPEHSKFDGIIAVEVFEHFSDPAKSLNQILKYLNKDGIICGTTNFYPGGPIEDGNEPGYMKNRGHDTYWSNKSMGYLASLFNYTLEAFEMIRPGSILPDEKYGQLWPNKRVFFLYKKEVHGSFFKELKKKTPILPIDKP